MTLRNALIRRLALVCLLQATGFTISAVCCQYASVTIDHTNGPSGTGYAFSFTRTSVTIDHDSEVRFLDSQFRRLLWCFMVGLQSANLNTCKLNIPSNSGTIHSLYLYSASVVGDFSTEADASPSRGENSGLYYICFLPDRFFNLQTSVNCTQQSLPGGNRYFKDTYKCITLNPLDTELKNYVHIIFKSEGQISLQYSTDIVAVNSCNPSSTTTGTISPLTRTTVSTSPDGEAKGTTASSGKETTGTYVHPAPETTVNSSALDNGTVNIGLIIGAVCGSLLLIALIVIGILCWKRPVVIWKRGRKLSTDPTQTGVSTSNVSQPSADNLIYHDEEIYPSFEEKHHTMSSISTSDYASLDSENIDTLEAPMRNKGSIKDVYASVHQSRKRANRQQQHENSNNQSGQNSENSENPKGKRHNVKDVYALIHKSRKREKKQQEPETNNNKNSGQNPQTKHDDVPSAYDETYATNNAKNGDQKKPNTYSKLHDNNVSSENPYDDLLEPNDYHDATSADAIKDLSNEELDCNAAVKPVQEVLNQSSENIENQPVKETDAKLKTKPVIPSKPKFLTMPRTKQGENANGIN